MNREEALACVKEQLTEHRYIHTIGVTDTAVILAGRFGYLDFIGPALIRHRDMEAHRTPGLSSSEDIARDPSRFHIRMLQQSELLEENPKERAEEKSKRLKAIQQGEPIPDSFSFDDQARRLLEWEYPYRELTAILKLYN